jgi:hypothetical protein
MTVLQVLCIILRKGNFKNKNLDLYHQTDIELNEILTKLLEHSTNPEPILNSIALLVLSATTTLPFFRADTIAE